jgi:transmembrane sensor
MSKERLQYLLNQHQAGLATPQEIAELESWYLAFEEKEDFTDTLSESAKLAAEKTLFNKINAKIGAEAHTAFALGKPVKKITFRSRVSGVAAALAVLFITGYVSYQLYQKPGLMHQSTAFGETRTVILPDGSMVILNGNSEITYPSKWSEGESRNVSMSGEAYFQVIHTKDHRRFIVKTSDDFSVQVLGTRFVLSKRKSGTRVVLNEGKVQCNLGENEKDTLVLRPGELVEFSKKSSQYTRKRVQPSLYSAWKDHLLVFDNTPLKDVTTILEETYGLVVKADHQKLLERKISGSVPTGNIRILLEGIAETCNVKVRQEDNNIYISDND